MSDKPDEHLDLRIRRAIETIDDTLPPGSTFDPGRGWEQLRSELTTPSAQRQRKRIGAWWLVAASVIGLEVGWFWWSGQLAPDTVQANRTNKTPQQVIKSLPEIQPHSMSLPVGNLPKVAEKGRNKPMKSSTEGEAKPAITVGQLPVQAVIAEQTVQEPPAISLVQADVDMATPSPVTTFAERRSASTVARKRRFRLVHENELPIVEEAHRVHQSTDRTERFVRIGSRLETPRQDDKLPPLLFPLNRKSSQ